MKETSYSKLLYFYLRRHPPHVARAARPHFTRSPRRGALEELSFHQNSSSTAPQRPIILRQRSVHFHHVQQPPSPCGPCRELSARVTRSGSAGTFLLYETLDDFHDKRAFSFTPPVLIHDYGVYFACWLKVFHADPQQKRCYAVALEQRNEWGKAFRNQREGWKRRQRVRYKHFSALAKHLHVYTRLLRRNLPRSSYRTCSRRYVGTSLYLVSWSQCKTS